MDMTQFLGGDWLKCEHLQGQDVPVQIESVSVEKYDNGDERPVLHFVGQKRKLGLNQTNLKQVMAFYGNDSDGWVGQWITLYPDLTVRNGEGQQTGGVRIRPIPPTGVAPAQPQQMTGAVPHPATMPTAAPTAFQL